MSTEIVESRIAKFEVSKLTVNYDGETHNGLAVTSTLENGRVFFQSVFHPLIVGLTSISLELANDAAGRVNAIKPLIATIASGGEFPKIAAEATATEGTEGAAVLAAWKEQHADVLVTATLNELLGE